MYKKILLPTDGSKNADKEIETALNIIDKENGEIIILSIASNIIPLQLPNEDEVISLNNLLLDNAKSNVQKMKEQINENIKITTKVVEGSPAKSIIEIAEEENVDLIIIASSGKSGIDRFFLGSVAEKVIKNAKNDVLLINKF
ncbi:MAG: universal stress protein [Methanobacteriaceae archaeon]|nr:universal stress protein [Methanobacteriaceae archaeon]